MIPSGVSQQFLQPLHIKKKGNDSPFHLLHVGRCVAEKNILFLLDIFAQLHAQNKRFIFTIIGYGSHYDVLKNYAYNTLQLSPAHMVFIHKPDKSIIARSYRDADLFLFSSLTDTQALVLAEAMGGSTPVVALEGPGQGAIIRNGVNGFLVKNGQEMAEVIEHVAENPDLHEALQHGAWKTAQTYAPEVRAGELVDFYRKFAKTA